MSAQPTVAEQAAIRQAGAQQNVNAGVTTEINQNPNEAQSEFANLSEGSSQTDGHTISPISSSPSPVNQPATGVIPRVQPNAFTSGSQPSSGRVETPIPRVQPNAFSELTTYRQSPNEILTINGKPEETTGAGAGRIIAAQYFQPQTQLDTRFIPRTKVPLAGAKQSVDQFNASVQNFIQGSAQGYENLRITLTQAGLKAPNPIERGLYLFAGGLSGEAAGFVNVIAGQTGKPANVQSNIASNTGTLLGYGAQAVVIGAGAGAFETEAGINTLGFTGRVASRFAYGGLFGAGTSIIAGQNPVTGALLSGGIFAGGGAIAERVVPFLTGPGREFIVAPRPNPSTVPSEDPYQLSVFSRVAQKLFGQPSPIDVSGEMSGSLFATSSSSSRASAFAQKVTDILGTPDTGSSTSFDKFIQDYGSGTEVSGGGGQVSILKQEPSGGTIQVQSEPETKIFPTQKETVQTSRQIQVGSYQDQTYDFYQKAQGVSSKTITEPQTQGIFSFAAQEAAKVLAVKQKLRRKAPQDQSAFEVIQFPPGTSQKSQQDLFQVQKTGLSLETSQILQTGQVQKLSLQQLLKQSQIQLTQTVQTQQLKTETVQELSFQQAFDRIFETPTRGEGLPFNYLTKKQKKKKRKRGTRKSYLEFGNIVNLKEFEL